MPAHPRWTHPRWTLPLLLAAAAGSQQPGTVRAAPPAHDPRPHLPPGAALEHLRSGHLRALAARAAGQEPAAAPRPSGAGRYVAAVLVCADADLDAAALFGCARRDLLVLATPSAHADPGVVALLEHFAAAERLSLVVVLTHDGCTALAAAPDTPSGRASQRRGDPARALAQARRWPLARAQAHVQREALLAASPRLRDLLAEGRMEIVPASLLRAGGLEWHGPRTDPAPVPAGGR